MKADHQVIGCKGWVQAAIQAVRGLFLTSIALVSADWLFVAFLMVSIFDLALHIPKEEQILIEAFGDEYIA